MTDEELTRRIFENDGYVKLSGIEILEITKEKSVVRAAIKEEHRNATGSAQGGMLYTVADFAFAILSNYLHPVTVTQGGQIHYVRAARTDEVRATAVEVSRTGHNTVCDVTVCDKEGETVCLCRFNGFVKEVDREELKKKFE